MKKNNFTVNNNQDGKRLFIVVSEHLSISKKQSQKIIDEKLVLINKKRIWMRNHNVKINDHIEKLYSNYIALNVVVTGGSSKFLLNRIKNAIFADQDFIAFGLNYIINYNENR